MIVKWFKSILVSCFLIALGCGGGGSDSKSDNNEIPSVYSVTVNGSSVPVKRISNFDVPVNYAHFSYPGTACEIGITADVSLDGYTLSPVSKGIGETYNNNAISFNVSEPHYLILQVPGQERLFIFIDPAEVDPPQLGDADVVNIMDYSGIDNTGKSDITANIQAAIDDLEGTNRTLYFPAGTYYTGPLFLKSDMTVYLAQGAELKCVNTISVGFHPVGLVRIEMTSRALIHMNGVTNSHLRGRGVVNGDGAYIRKNKGKMFLVKIEESSDCTIEGVIARDSSFWNTMIYRSDEIHISNYKVINNKLNNEYNETDGVDFNNCTDSSLYNAFLYTGDDCMAVKSDDIRDENTVDGIYDPTDLTDDQYINVANVAHEKIVCFSGSSACKVGTKTFGETMSNISFTDVDIITASRGLVIDAVDKAMITGTVFQNIRIENLTGRLIDFNMDPAAITWRVSQGECEVDNTSVINVSSSANAACRISGNNYGGTDHLVDNTTITNLTINGNSITAVDDEDLNTPFDTNEFTGSIVFN